MNTPDESTYTQYRQNGVRSVLDLIFTTEQLAEIAANWAILGEAATGSDHKVIYFKLLLDSAAFVENPMMTASIFNTKRAEWGKFHNCLVADWVSTKIRIDELLALNTECGMDQAAICLQEAIFKAAEQAIPKRLRITRNRG